MLNTFNANIGERVNLSLPKICSGGIKGSLLFFISLSLFICLLFSGPVLFAQEASNIRFTTFQKEDGLSNNAVNDITKDNLGFIWIATEDGLCRYDAVGRMKVYFKEAQDTNKLQSSNIHALYNDKQGNLWIGTRQGGLTRLDQSTGKWTTYRHEPNNPKSISNDEVLTIAEDRQGRLWLGTENGLNLFNTETETFTTFKADRDNPTALQSDAILTIVADEQGFLWIGTWGGGLHLLLPEESDLAVSQFKQVLPATNKASHNVWKVLQDKQKRYWVGTHEGGLFLMQLPEGASNKIDNQTWQPSFHNYAANKTASFGLPNNLVKDLLQDKDGNLWIATANGLSFIAKNDLPTDKFLLPTVAKPKLKIQTYYADVRQTYSLAGSIINAIFQDDQGLLWIGTLSGISQYNSQDHQFEIHQLEKEADLLPLSNIFDISKKGIITYGSLNKGLVRYNIETKKSTPLSSQINRFLQKKPVTYLHSTDDKTMYIGTNEGIVVLDLKTQDFKYHPLPDNILDNIFEFGIRCMDTKKQKEILIGTKIGLFVLNANTGIYTHFENNPLDTTSLSDNSINAVLRDSKGYVWVATYGGLNRFRATALAQENLAAIKFENFKASSKQDISNRIISLEEVKDEIFMGSTSGLYAYDYSVKKFVNYSIEGNNYWIQSIAKTTEGNLWASTKEGIFYFDQQTGSFNTFGKKDGLSALSFRQGSSFMDEAGFIYFGSKEGFVRLHPNSIEHNTVPPSIYITDIKTMNFEGESYANTINQEQIKIGYDDYYLSINFAALNYNRPEKNKYAYKLEGFADNWTYTSENTPVVYTNLKAGNYTFKVKAANNDGYWNEKEASIKIIKKTAFWQKNSFFCLLFVLFSALLFFGFQLYFKYLHGHYNKMELYNQKLNKEIKERERMEQILKAKNTELMRSNNDLEQFAYIASHDLQAPLRTISSFSRLLERSLPAKMTLREQEFFHFITQSVGNMQALVDDLLTFSRVNSQKLKLQDINPSQLVDNILRELDTTLKETNAKVQLSNFPELISADKIKLKQLLQNLISNGIKFSKEGVAPVVQIACLENEDYWQFEVKDNGIGISKEFNDKIFKLFQRLHTSEEYKGTGIGLTLCKKIVEQHNGEIIVDSEIGKGSSFIFTISRSLN